MKMKKRTDEFIEFTRLLKGYGYNSVSLAADLGCSPPTAKKKLDEPRLFTLADISRINLKGHIPIDEIREAITVRGYKVGRTSK